MIWAAPAAAVLVALITAAATGPVLRRLPEPTDDPDAADKLPYIRLATPRFITAVGVLSLASSLLAFGRVPPEHWLSWVALSGPGALAVAIDAATTWLPRYVTRAMGVTAAAGIGVCWTWTGNAQVPLRGLAGFVLMGGFFWLTWRITGGIGYADVRLMGVVGAVTAAWSSQASMAAVLLGTAFGAAWGIVCRVRRGAVPFAYGPPLWSGAFLALLLPTLA